MYISKLLCLFCMVFGFCVSVQGQRKPRLFSFNSQSGDIDVALDFSIPFVKIPLNRFDTASTLGLHGLAFPKINVNPAALAIGGLLMVVTSYIGPIINKVFDWGQWDRSSRVLNNELPGIYRMERIVEISGGCPQRAACWLSQTSPNGISLRTWNQLLSNELLSQMVNTTALVAATTRGLRGINCEEYSPCPIMEEDLPKLISNFNIIKNEAM